MTGKRISGITCIIKSATDSVVRAAQNRRLEEAPGKLFELPEVLATAGSHTLNVMQKGGRAARQARMFISYSEVSIKNPDNSGQALPLTYVCCREQAEDGACWHLLTSGKAASAADARRIVSHYERRWLTEEYHKAWKSGGTWNRCECRPGITLSAWWLSRRL
ncbi:hypothetical protein BMA04_004211 [Shigella boydii]|nr:hypothetical protein [Shigella boydii]